MASLDRRSARAVAGALLAVLCASSTCTVEFSAGDDCDDPNDPDCNCSGTAPAPPPPQVFEVLLIEPDGNVRSGYAWVEPARAR